MNDSRMLVVAATGAHRPRPRYVKWPSGPLNSISPPTGSASMNWLSLPPSGKRGCSFFQYTCPAARTLAQHLAMIAPQHKLKSALALVLALLTPAVITMLSGQNARCRALLWCAPCIRRTVKCRALHGAQKHFVLAHIRFKDTHVMDFFF